MITFLCVVLYLAFAVAVGFWLRKSSEQCKVMEENYLASISTLTKEETAMLFEGERRETDFKKREIIWSQWHRDQFRLAHNMMRLEE